MSLEGMKTQITWVKKRLKDLKYEVNDIDAPSLTNTFEDLDAELDGLIEECEGTISDIKDL